MANNTFSLMLSIAESISKLEAPPMIILNSYAQPKQDMKIVPFLQILRQG